MRQMPFHQRHQHMRINMHNIFAIIQGTEPHERNFEGTGKRDPHIVKKLGDERARRPITQPDALHLMHAKHEVAHSPGNILMIWCISFKLAEFNLTHHKPDLFHHGCYGIRKGLLCGIIVDKLRKLIPSSTEIHKLRMLVKAGHYTTPCKAKEPGAYELPGLVQRIREQRVLQITRWKTVRPEMMADSATLRFARQTLWRFQTRHRQHPTGRQEQWRSPKRCAAIVEGKRTTRAAIAQGLLGWATNREDQRLQAWGRAGVSDFRSTLLSLPGRLHTRYASPVVYIGRPIHSPPNGADFFLAMGLSAR